MKKSVDNQPGGKDIFKYMQVSGLTKDGAQPVKYCKQEEGERGKADES